MPLPFNHQLLTPQQFFQMNPCSVSYNYHYYVCISPTRLTSKVTMSRWPSAEATCRGVFPSSSLISACCGKRVTSSSTPLEHTQTNKSQKSCQSCAGNISSSPNKANLRSKMDWGDELEVHQGWISTSIQKNVHAPSSTSIHCTMKSCVPLWILKKDCKRNL